MKSFIGTLILTIFFFNTIKAQVKATSAEVNTGTDDTKFITPLALQGSKYLDQNGGKISAVTDAAANTYTAAIVPAITSYTSGQLFYIKITTGNTGASTLNLNGLGARALVKDAATALTSGDLISNKVYAMYYDGTNFQVMNAVPGTSQSAITVANNKLLGRFAASAGAPQDISLGPGLTLNSSGTLYSGAETGADNSDTKIVKFSNPTGGQFRGVGTIAGAIKIQLPSNNSVMYSIRGTLYQFDGAVADNRTTSFLITCFGSNMTNGFSATFTGNNAPNYPVRWYTDGTKPAIYIGELTSNWNYVTVTIDEVQASYFGTNLNVVSNGWGVSLESAFTGTLAATQMNTLPASNLSQRLAGFAVGTNIALSNADNVIGAFGKIQAQLNSRLNFSATQPAGTILAAPALAIGTPSFRVLNKADTRWVFGADATSGILDWNDITNTQPGFSPTLLLGSATNGFGNATYYHPFTVMYASKDGAGNLTQLAYPYNPGVADGIFYRTRYSNVYTPWRKVWDSINFTNLSQLTTRNFSDLQNKPATLSGYGITDGATQASVTTMDGNVVHKTGNENIAGTKLFSTSIGIATTNTFSYKLAVGGGIIAESIKIKPQALWADYVFEKGYPILPLKDLERFILKNKHLPGIPTASEVKKEGVDLGEINTKLLQKIEELTLYVIDLKKENESLKKDTNEKIGILSEMIKKLNEDLHPSKK